MMKRIMSLFLALVLVLSCVPVIPASAEEAVHYELVDEKEGIDYNAEYLIVATTKNWSTGVETSYALNGAGAAGGSTYVTVEANNTILDFNGASDCLWTIDKATNSLKHGDKYLVLNKSTSAAPSYQSTPFELKIDNKGAGKFSFYVNATSGNYVYYLSGSASHKFASGYTTKTYATGLRLFQKVGGQSECTISFNGNGNTHGVVPESVKVKAGEEYTFGPADENLRMEWGNDTYLFWCWTDKQDGTGTEYRPGDTIIVSGNMELYAQWYKQTKYKITVVTDLDDIHTDIHKIMGEEVNLYVRLDQENSPLLPLTREAEGVYSVNVTENGTYLVYAQHGDHEPEEEHGHKVIIYNQDGSTELLHYSVSYYPNGGAFENAPATQNYHANTTVTATNEIPVLAGHRFLGWKDQNGNLIAPGELVAEKLLEKTTLIAQWEDLVDVTVNITVNHNGDHHEEDIHKVLFNLLQQVGGVDMPVESVGTDQLLGANSADWNYSFDPATEIATFSRTFTALPQGIYTAAATLSHYEATVTRTGASNEDQQINISMIYNPDSFDLEFDVVVNYTEETKHLLPVAVNVRVLCWNGTQWEIIDRQGDGTPPVSVFIDETGRGHDFFPVWQHWGNGEYYAYRVAVTSFVMPDGTVVKAKNTQADKVYVPDGSGLYTATVTVEKGGVMATYPGAATLPGAEYDENAENEQNGMPTVTVNITPFTVTFDAGEGTLDGERKVVLTNQYQYPDLRNFVPVPDEYDGRFAGWFLNGKEAANKAGSYLTGNVTYVAQYDNHKTIQGQIYVNSNYFDDGREVEIAESDRIKNVMVILQKNINGVYNDVDSCLVELRYNGSQGTGEYIFDHLMADGTEYRVYVLQHNHDVTYDNNGDDVFTEEEYAVAYQDNVAVVDMKLQMNPESYEQIFEVDVKQIGEAFRPNKVNLQILYRDLGDRLPYNVIAQHKDDPVTLMLDYKGTATGYYDVWKWHNNVTLYEYQLKVTKLFGDIDIYTTVIDEEEEKVEQGVEYSDDLPFKVVYDSPTYYVSDDSSIQPVLKATLVPKDYKITFDLNLGTDTQTPIYGMEDYLVDNDNEDQYAFFHTWSQSKDFTAFPYREGYVFLGWEENYDHVFVTEGGYVHVDAELAGGISLTAKWQKLEGVAYTVRHLEMTTNNVLKGAQAFTGSVALGSTVKAYEKVQSIEGYEYVGAMVGGIYYDKTKDPGLVVGADPAENLLILYYRPDGSDGYTDPVEENIHLQKDAVLEDNGTYTITMETYTKDNPITTRVQQNTPLDIVLVLDQSGSIKTSNFLGELQNSVTGFIELIAEHGREHAVDHRIAIVGYASDEEGGLTTNHPPAGALDGTKWVNTGVFDSNGDFHVYPVTGFNYTPYTGTIETTGTYYTESNGEYLLMTFHDIYRHLITEEEAKQSVLNGVAVYGYVGEDYVQLTRNTSGLWLYGNKQLYSETEFFTQHTNVWTHRRGTEAREIHAYMVDGKYVAEAGHEKVFVRAETQESGADKSIYEDALIPVTMSAGGAGGINPGLLKSTQRISANGLTYVSYGMEMANRIFAANPQENGGVRIVVVFTDGKPGDSSNFDEDESNKAIAQSYIASNEYKARVFTVGVYGKDVANAESDQDYFMNGLSSNYPDAKSLDDVWVGVTYRPATPGYSLEKNGPYFVEVNKNHYPLSREVVYEKGDYYIIWGYDNAGTRVVVTRNLSSYGHPIIDENSQVTDVAGNKVTLYRRAGHGYKPAESKNYYTVAENTHVLKQYFADIVTSITTKITTEITLYDDTIIRDIMGQGLVLTPGSTITVSQQMGVFNPEDQTITWSGVNKQLASVTIPERPDDAIVSNEKADISYELPDGTVVERPSVPYIGVYNLQSANPTDPDGDNYHPHTVDITGYDFTEWYISEEHTVGAKMVITIDRVEARDDVVWGRVSTTNYEQSGLWLPQTDKQERQLLLAFDQPTTIFVERAYVLDYGKQFTLSDWYFDDEPGKDADPVHLDLNVDNGMNYFEPTAPTTQNSKNSQNGNTKYGNVKIQDGKVTYTPTTMNWGGYDEFYVFGDTWRNTVVSQDANENGNLWNKVTVIPANNIYYEDSFKTEISTDRNGIEGFTFTGDWTFVEGGGNKETPEKSEEGPYGGAHGWTDDLADDNGFTDGGYSFTNQENAMVEFTFTGTGVDVYTRTNVTSGKVIAVLSKPGVDKDGNRVLTAVKSLIMDNLAMSGDYYQIPTVSFDKLVYGTYTLQIMVMEASATMTGQTRTEYYVDGVRIYNPMGIDKDYGDEKVKDAYGLELNAVFTEVRDILLGYGDFNPDMNDSTNGREGAVFIDQIKEGQEQGDDVAGTAGYTYEIGTFEAYGPKNEVYLSPGQAIVLKVDESNTYYVGMKSLTGGQVIANVSGITKAEATQIKIEHTADLYYKVAPVDGYIVIQNGGTAGVLSITNLRTTNMKAPVEQSGVMMVGMQEALMVMRAFDAAEKVPAETEKEEIVKPSETPKEDNSYVAVLFGSVRAWLEV